MINNLKKIQEIMKIIKSGKIPSSDRQFTCGYCGCVFVADNHNDMCRDPRGDAYVICPTCKKYIDWKNGCKPE